MEASDPSAHLASLPGAESMFYAPQIDRNLLLDFLMVFSRFEYSLKRGEFLEGNEKRAWPNWDKFGAANHERFDTTENVALKDAVDLLCRKPPKKQVIKDKQLEWEDVAHNPKEPQFLYVLRLVRTIRNNLFHGGKFRDGSIDDPARDHQLLQSALTVLRASVSFDSEISDVFGGANG